jgi:hypothetical protein
MREDSQGGEGESRERKRDGISCESKSPKGNIDTSLTYL